MAAYRSFEETHRTAPRLSVTDEILAGIGLGIVLVIGIALLHLA